jgi:serpin B
MTRTRSPSFSLSALLVGATLASACTTPRTASDKATTVAPPVAHAPPDRPPTVAAEVSTIQIADAVNGMGFDLYAKARTQPGNVVFSPASIGFALGMVYGGAGGVTAEDLARTMHVHGIAPDPVHQGFAGLLARTEDHPGAKLRIANRIWAQEDIEWAPAFMSVTSDRYRAPAERADFTRAAEATRKTINDWVSKTTRSLDANSVMVLVNAIWFKGQWAQQFKPEATRDAPFTMLDGKQVQVKTMHQSAPARLGKVGDIELLELDYAGSDLSMVLALSRAPSPATGLDALEKRLTAANLSSWLGALRELPEVHIALPRFQAKQTLPLKQLLQELGLTSLFTRGRADLSPMLASAEKVLYVSGAFHQAFVNVNEEGAEAAAATAIVVAVESAAPHHAFTADRPFVWMIRDKKTGLVLFIGRVVDPR